ncbi:MAG: hypothetical protein HYW62_01325 [Candidatus Levybacteria bacterium]|nr:hypothetical protein [Candidatus Levybacteria bacterium]
MNEYIGQSLSPDEKEKIIEEARENLMGLFEDVRNFYGRTHAEYLINTLGENKEKRAVLSFGTVDSDEGQLEVVTVWPIFRGWDADDKLLLIVRRAGAKDNRLLKFYAVPLSLLPALNVNPEFPVNVENTRRIVGISRSILNLRENRARREITIEQTIGFLDKWQGKSS